MKIEETFAIDAPRERVWRFITDPNEMGPCIPGCQDIEVTGPTRMWRRLRSRSVRSRRPSIWKLRLPRKCRRTTFSRKPRGEEGSRASQVSAENVLRLSDAENGGTEVFYSSEVTIAGRLGKYGHGIMKKIAKKLGEKFATAFRERVEAAETEEA